MTAIQSAAGTPEEVISRMIRAHQTSMLRLCYAILHDRTMAEDAVQETFLKAYRSLGSFRGDAQEKTWLTRIAINVCRDMRRSAWFRLVDRRITPEMLPEPAVEASAEDGEVTAAVMNLPLRMREVVVLYYYQELNSTEIAEALHISHQAVSDRLGRARKRLRTVLENAEREVTAP